MGPGCKVHVSDGSPGEHESCQHLGEVVGGNSVAVARVENGTLQKPSVAGGGVLYMRYSQKAR